MKIKLRELKEHPKNLIYDIKEDVEFIELMNSIKVKLEHPIVINKDNYILSGHRRYRAAIKLGWTEIEYIRKEFKNDYEELEYILTENIYRIKTTIERGKEGKLLEEIETLKAKERQGWKNNLHNFADTDNTTENNDIDQSSNSVVRANLHEGKKRTDEVVAEKVGMKQRTYSKVSDILDETKKLEPELASFVENIANNSVDAAHKLAKKSKEEIQKVKEKAESGEKYKSISSVIKEVEKEKHQEERKKEVKDIPEDKSIRIFNDDCRNVLKKIKDNSIDMVLTDPPYGIDFKSSWKAENKEDFNDGLDDVIPLLNEVCQLLQKKCKQDAHLYFFSSWMSYSTFESIISKYFDISNVIIWEKNNTSLVDFDKRYGFSYEQIIFCKQKGNNERMLNNKSSRDVVHFNRINNPDHTCEKPVDLLQHFIYNSTIEGELVVDCFAGTFNTAIAAKNSNRRYIGVELSPDFFKKGKNKLDNYETKF